MGERGEVTRYAYWSDRTVRRVAHDNEIALEPRWRTKITIGQLPFIRASFDAERPARALFRSEIAERIERGIGAHAVEDFGLPEPVLFAKGVGRMMFAHFMCGERNRVVLHTDVVSPDGSRVGVVLFGSCENLPAWTGVTDAQVPGWTSSAAWDVLPWLASRCRVNDSQYDDPESISLEAWRIATDQGANADYRTHPEQSWRRGYTFADADAEWFADIFSDVVLDRRRWRLDADHVDRILVGAPLWVRTPRAALRRYRDLRRQPADEPVRRLLRLWPHWTPARRRSGIRSHSRR